MDLGLTGKTAVVTGASKGIGGNVTGAGSVIDGGMVSSL